jgi:hypothetical protein
MLFRRAGSRGSTAGQEARRYPCRDHRYPPHFKGCQGVQPAIATLHKYFVRFAASVGFYWWLNMTDSQQLLAEYVRNASDIAFRELVTRYVDLVYSTALRRVRGVTTTAASLGVVLSANVVQAAPVGLAVTISTAAALAGTTIATRVTATTTKAIARTTLQRTIVLAAIAVAAGAGIYEARQNSKLHEESQVFQQQQAPLAEQIQLEHEDGNTTRQLAALRDDNERLSCHTTEIARLRSEVAHLREALRGASDQSVVGQPATNSNALAPILKMLWGPDPAEVGDNRRFKAAEQLGELGDQTVPGLSVFRELLRSGKQGMAHAGARALAFTSKVSPEPFRALRIALSDPDPRVRDAAAPGVSLVFNSQFENVQADSNLPKFVQNLRDIDDAVRSDTALAILQYIQEQKQKGNPGGPDLVIPALRQNAEDKYGMLDCTLCSAVFCLQEYGDMAKAGIPQLEKLRQDPGPQAQSAAKRALERVSNFNSSQNMPHARKAKAHRMGSGPTPAPRA